MPVAETIVGLAAKHVADSAGLAGIERDDFTPTAAVSLEINGRDPEGIESATRPNAAAGIDWHPMRRD